MSTCQAGRREKNTVDAPHLSPHLANVFQGCSGSTSLRCPMIGSRFGPGGSPWMRFLELLRHLNTARNTIAVSGSPTTTFNMGMSESSSPVGMADAELEKGDSEMTRCICAFMPAVIRSGGFAHLNLAGRRESIGILPASDAGALCPDGIRIRWTTTYESATRPAID